MYVKSRTKKRSGRGGGGSVVAIKRAVDSAGPYLYRKKMKMKKKERRWMGLGREVYWRRKCLGGIGMFFVLFWEYRV